MSRQGIVLGAVVAACIAAATTAPAMAQAQAQAAADSDQLEEVIVTAEKVSDTEQRTAISMQVVTGAQIAQQGLNNVQDVLKAVPGVVVRNTAQGAVIDIRGISSGVLANNDSDPAVGISLDGVYAPPIGGVASQTTYYDVKNIEVLRGPQGTLYGASAEAGVLLVETNDPTIGKYDATALIEAGNYDLIHVSGAVNLPLNDVLAFRFAGNSVHSNGYYTSGFDDNVSTAGRAKLLYQPTDSLRVLLGADYSLNKGEGPIGGRNEGVPAWANGDAPAHPYDDLALGIITPYNAQNVPTLRTWLKVDWTTPIGTLTLLPSHIYSPGTSYATYDNSGSAATAGPTECASTGCVVDYNNNTTTQTSGEVRLASLASSPVKWLVGAYDANIKSTNYGDTFGTSALSNWEVDEAVYGQATVPVVTGTRLVGGLRYGSSKRSFFNTAPFFSGLAVPGSGSKTYDRVDWKAGLEQDITPDSMAYLTVATGYRPGSLQESTSSTIKLANGSNGANNSIYTNPEELLSYELGIKNEFLNHTLRVNADVYYYDYKNRQYTAFFLTNVPECPNGQAAAANPFGGGYGPCLQEGNANKSRSIGAEVESVWAATKNDQLGLNLAYLNAKANADQIVYLGNNTTANINGDTMPDSPAWQITGSYQHAFEIGGDGAKLTPHVDVRYTSTNYLNGFDYLQTVAVNGTNGALFVQPSYVEVDANLMYTSSDGKWTVNGYMKNANNVVVKNQTDGTTTTAAAPRTFGAVVNWHM